MPPIFGSTPPPAGGPMPIKRTALPQAVLTSIFVLLFAGNVALAYKYFALKAQVQKFITAPPSSGPTAVPTVTPAPSAEISLITPQPNELLESPVMIQGTAPKSWTFESVLKVSLEDERHQLLVFQPVSTQELPDGDRVSFDISMPFTTDHTAGFLIIANDNPSGLPANAKSYSIPVRFIPHPSSRPLYTCPSNGWINCMPILTPKAQQACTQEAIQWYRANCPHFQGVAQ